MPFPRAGPRSHPIAPHVAVANPRTTNGSRPMTVAPRCSRSCPDKTCTPTLVLIAELATEETREYRRREARSLKKESQSSLTSLLAGAEVEFVRTTMDDGDAAFACGRESRFSVAAAGRAVVELRRVSCLDAIRGVVWRGRRAPASEGAAGFSRPRDIAVRIVMLMGLAFIMVRNWNWFNCRFQVFQR